MGGEGWDGGKVDQMVLSYSCRETGSSGKQANVDDISLKKQMYLPWHDITQRAHLSILSHSNQ